MNRCMKQRTADEDGMLLSGSLHWEDIKARWSNGDVRVQPARPVAAAFSSVQSMCNYAAGTKGQLIHVEALGHHSIQPRQGC